MALVCSRCGEIIKSGWDYRWHFDQHLDEYDSAVDKFRYVQSTTTVANQNFLKKIYIKRKSRIMNIKDRILNKLSDNMVKAGLYLIVGVVAMFMITNIALSIMILVNLIKG